MTKTFWLCKKTRICLCHPHQPKDGTTMPRYLDRYLDGEEWEHFLRRIMDIHNHGGEPDCELLQEEFTLSQRTTRRTIRRAEKKLGLNCSVPPEVSKRKKKNNGFDDEDSHLTPLQKLASSIDWRYMTVIEKAQTILGDRITESRAGYNLDGRPCRIDDIVARCNFILEMEGIEKIPN